VAAKKQKSEDAKRHEKEAKAEALAKKGQSKGNAVAKNSKEAKGTSAKSKSPHNHAKIRYNGNNVPKNGSKTGSIENVQHEVSQILTVGKGASPSNLKTVVEMIPKNIICEMYNCTSFSSFEVKINENWHQRQIFPALPTSYIKFLKSS
jgi:membrane protein involved in colicin uptake